MRASVEKEFEDILSFLEHVALLSGLTIRNEVRCNFLLGFYHFINITLICGHIYGIFHYIRESSADFSKTSIGIVFLIEVSQTVSKLILYHHNKSKILSLLEIVQLFRLNKIQTEDEWKICKKVTKRAFYISRSIPAMYFFAALGVLFTPHILGTKSLALPFVIPIISEDYKFFTGINFIYQSVIMCVVVLPIIMVDILFLLLVQEVCLQTEVLQEKFKFLGKSFKDGGVLEDKQFANLHQLYMDHQEMKQYIFNLNKIFSPFLLTQLFNSTIGIAFELLNISQANEIHFAMGQALMAWCFQVFLWCFFGEQARNKVNNMLKALYNNEWYQLNVSCQKSLLIMMSCVQKNYSFNTGWIDLRMATFSAIMKTAYSYYTVMNRT